MRYALSIDRDGKDYALVYDTLEAAETAFNYQCNLAKTFRAQVWAIDAEGNGKGLIMNYEPGESEQTTMLTWFDLSKVADGTRVVFVEAHDIFPTLLSPPARWGP